MLKSVLKNSAIKSGWMTELNQYENARMVQIKTRVDNHVQLTKY